MKSLKFLSALLLGLFLMTSTSVQAQKQGVETRDGKKYIIHRVEAKQTVYSISRLYNISQETFLELNPSTAEVIKTGQEVLIPYEEGEDEGTDNVDNPKLQMSSEEGQAMQLHTVQKGEWLSKIAREYGVTLDDIKKWNDIKDETIKPGQELIVGIGTSRSLLKNNSKKGSLANNQKNSGNKTINKTIAKNTLKTGVYTKDVEHTVVKGESLAKLKEKYGVSMAAIREKNNLASDNLKIGQKLLIPVKPGDNNSLAQNTNPQNKGGNTGSALNAANKNNPTNAGNADPLAQLSANSGNPANTNSNPNVDPLAQLSGNSGNTSNTSNTDPLAQFSGNAGNTPNSNSFDNGLARGGSQGNQGNVNQGNTNQNNQVNVLQGKYSFPKTHIVQRGESMDKLVRQYNVSRSFIKYWNQLPDNNLREGQALKIYEPHLLTHRVQMGETKETIAKKYLIKPVYINKWNNLEHSWGIEDINVGQELAIYEPTGPLTPSIMKMYNLQPPAQSNHSNPNGFTGNQSNLSGFAGNNGNTANSGNADPLAQLNGGNNNPNPTNNGGNASPKVLTYEVVGNESLYDIAQIYGIDDPKKIAEWNNLANYRLFPKQKLRIYPNGKPNNNGNVNNIGTQQNTSNPGLMRGAGDPNVLKNKNPTVYDNPYGSTANKDPYDPGNYQAAQAGNKNTPTNTTQNNNNRFNSSDWKVSKKTVNDGISSELEETGFAEVLTNIASPRPFAALHSSRPGTLVMVTNPANNKMVVVEVVGNLNAAQARAGVIIQITQAAYNRLGGIGETVPIKVRYSSGEF